MIENLLAQAKEEFEQTIDNLNKEITQIRTGRASSSLVEDIMIDYYGSKSPIKQVASISIPEPRQILVTPWNKADLISIEAGIRDSQLNLNPVNDGEALRITLPELNEERRKELVKILNQKTEEARIRIRNTREEIWDQIQKSQQEGEISEDDKFRSKDRLQEIVDEYNKKIEDKREKKEKEVMTV